MNATYRQNIHYDLLRTGDVEMTTNKIIERGFLDVVRVPSFLLYYLFFFILSTLNVCIYSYSHSLIYLALYRLLSYLSTYQRAFIAHCKSVKYSIKRDRLIVIYFRSKI